MPKSNLKLGKLPARVDNRTLKIKNILRLKLLPKLPVSFDLDEALDGIDDDRVFNNKKYGDCVIAARAHQTLRFEKFEQGIQPEITDQEVIDQYFKETGGVDSGLILLSSLKKWRNEGWKVGGKTYTIYAFAAVDWKDHTEVKHCIHLLGGVNFGMYVYQTDINQFNAGEGWHLTDNDGAYQGGHGVYACKYTDATIQKFAALLSEQVKSSPQKRAQLPRTELIGYNDEGVWCMTWGVKQFMTWDFWDKRVDEAYGIVDNRNDWLGEDSPVDVEKLQGYLDEITAGNEQPSDCPIGKLYVAAGNWIAKHIFRSDTRIPRPVKIR